MASKSAKSGKAKTPKVKDYIESNTDKELLGERYTVCDECGKIFEQEARDGALYYTSWKICPECRAKRIVAAKRKQEREREVTGTEDNQAIAKLPYTPFPSQRRLHKEFETHRFLVIDRGNRWGKDRFTTMAGIMYFVEILNENRFIDKPDMSPPAYWWIVAPTERMTKQNWRELKQYFPKEWVIAISESTLTMETIGGGIIEARSAYDPESLVGVGLDLVTITEAARIAELDKCWANLEARLSSPGRGRKIDRGTHSYGLGKAIINSSPIGQNYFYKMWQWGQEDSPEYNSDWYSEKLPWTDNPMNNELAQRTIKTAYGDISYEEGLRRRLGDALYRQNYLAEFNADSGTVFGSFEEDCVTSVYSNELNLTRDAQKKYIDDWRKPEPFTPYRIAWDIATGSSSDTPAVVVRNMTNNRIVRIVSLYGESYDEQYDSIAELSKMYNGAECVYSLTGHTAVLGQLEKRGVPEVAVNEQGGNKAQFVHRLVSAVENKVPKVLYDGSKEAYTLIAEMKDYTEKSPNVYSNSKRKGHDDFVSAMYLAFYDFEAVPNTIPFIGLYSVV